VHGTNTPASIYQAVTHGCIRMHPDDVAALFELVEEGTAGAIVYEPILLVEAGGEIWLEVHPDVYRRGRGTPLAQVRALAGSLGLDGRMDWSVAGRLVSGHDGIAQVVTLR
jgi:L,D-transpeptidase ErfK/SrfK